MRFGLRVRHGHGDVTLLAVHGKIGYDDVIVLGLQAGSAGLEVPDVFAGVGFDGDNTSGEEFVSTDFDVFEFPVIDASAGGTEDDEVGHGIVGDRGPGIASSDLPGVLAGPGLCGHLQSFRFKRFGRIAGNGPEAPGFLSGFGVVSDEGSPHAVVGAVVSHEHFAFGHVRGSGDAGLSCITDRGFPHLASKSGIDRYEPTVAGANVHFAGPHGDTRIGAR